MAKKKNSIEPQPDSATETIAPLAIVIPTIEVKKMTLNIVGDSPYIQHAWSQKAIEMLLGKQMKKPKSAKEARNPWKDFCDSLYWLSKKPAEPSAEDVDNATFGIPSTQFKSAAVEACRFIDGVKMTVARGAFHVNGEFVKILAGPPRMREDMVKIGMGVSDIRFRGEFMPWRAEVSINYNSSVLTLEQISNLFNAAGFGVGIGEWRPSRDGSMGRFHVG